LAHLRCSDDRKRRRAPSSGLLPAPTRLPYLQRWAGGPIGTLPPPR
jgi:hypothetical protein